MNPDEDLRAVGLRAEGWVCLDPEALDRLDPEAVEGLRDLERGRAVIPIITVREQLRAGECPRCGGWPRGYHTRTCPHARNEVS